MLEVDIGDDLKQVGYSPKVEGVANDGPQSFAIDRNFLYILDTLNKKILVFDNFIWLKSIDISVCSYARDILASDNKLYILDETNVIITMDTSGKILEIKNLPEEIETYQVTKTSLNKDGNVMLYCGGYEYIENDSEWDLVEGIDVEINSNKAKIKKEKNIKNNFIEVNFIEKTGGINVIGQDKYGNSYIEVIDDVPDSSLVLIESTLRKYDKSGKLTSIARIPIEDYYNYPHRFFNVTEDGEVYIMALMENHVEINRITLGKMYDSRMNELKKEAEIFNDRSLLNVEDDITPYADPTFPTRSDVQKRADAMINLTWSYKSTNAENPNTTTVTKPTHLAAVKSFPSTQVGIPYCWGGFDGIDRSSSSSWGSFTGAMAANQFAGNVNCDALSYRSPGTAGVDCSGFVSAALGLTSKYNTSGLYNNIGVIKTTSPLNMDFYVVPGWHVLFFSSWTDSTTTTINSKESTTDGTKQAAKNWTRTKNYLSINEYKLKTVW